MVMLIVACFLLAAVFAVDANFTRLGAGIVHMYVTKSGEDRVFCINQTNHQSTVWSLFEDTLIVVNETNSQKLSWHSVKGVSTDDLHAHLEHAVYWLAEKLQPGQIHHEQAEPYDVDSIFRDISSACPSALFSKTRSSCSMRFSTFGNACITVKAPKQPDRHLHLSVHTKQRFNQQYIYNLVVGATLVLFAGFMGKSKVFQVILRKNFVIDKILSL